jgi:hypothetical protein
VAAKAVAALRWDSFIDDDSGNKRKVDIFRKTEWRQIKLNARRENNLILSIEPHWVTPGMAVYWQQTETMKGVPAHREDGSERPHTALVSLDETRQWVQTGPLPAGNNSHLAYYLQVRGFRLRPPDIESVEAPVGSQVEAEASPPAYVCGNHHRSMGFATWDAYLAHCTRYGEHPAGMPAEIAERAQEFIYYCVLHDTGMNNHRAADHHYRYFNRRERARRHPTPEQMEVKV